MLCAVCTSEPAASEPELLQRRRTPERSVPSGPGRHSVPPVQPRAAAAAPANLKEIHASDLVRVTALDS